MAVDGTYGFVYSGAIGLGCGVLTVVDGKLKGEDYVGGKYTGNATEQPNGTIKRSYSPSRSGQDADSCKGLRRRNCPTRVTSRKSCRPSSATAPRSRSKFRRASSLLCSSASRTTSLYGRLRALDWRRAGKAER